MEITLKLEGQEIEQLSTTACSIVAAILSARSEDHKLSCDTTAQILVGISGAAGTIVDKVVERQREKARDELERTVKGLKDFEKAISEGLAATRGVIRESRVAFEDLPSDVQETILERRAGKKSAHTKTQGKARSDIDHD